MKQKMCVCLLMNRYNHGLASCNFQIVKSGEPKMCIKLKWNSYTDGNPAMLG